MMRLHERIGPMEGHKMKYVRFNVNDELEKVANGKKTKVDVGLLLYIATDKYPVAQRRIAKTFSIIEN
jgi:hypothetical protein